MPDQPVLAPSPALQDWVLAYHHLQSSDCVTELLLPFPGYAILIPEPGTVIQYTGNQQLPSSAKPAGISWSGGLAVVQLLPQAHRLWKSWQEKYPDSKQTERYLVAKSLDIAFGEAHTSPENTSPFWKEIDRLLRDELPAAGQVHEALNQCIHLVLQRSSPVTIHDMTEHVCCSVRSLERWFEKNCDMTPKLFLELHRFCRATHGLQNHLSVSEIVERCGYFDQSHYLHEFRRFTGLTPGKYAGGQFSVFRRLIQVIR